MANIMTKKYQNKLVELNEEESMSRTYILWRMCLVLVSQNPHFILMKLQGHLSNHDFLRLMLKCRHGVTFLHQQKSGYIIVNYAALKV